MGIQDDDYDRTFDMDRDGKLDCGGVIKWTMNILRPAFMPFVYAVRDDKLIVYADLSFEKMIKDGVITEITLEPKEKVSMDDIYKYLLVNGICGVDVKESQDSYR